VYSYSYLIARLFKYDYPDLYEWMVIAHKRYMRNIKDVIKKKEEMEGSRYSEIYFFDSRFEDFFIPRTLKPRPFSQYLIMRIRRQMLSLVEKKLWKRLRPDVREKYDEKISLDFPTDESSASYRKEYRKGRDYIYYIQYAVRKKAKSLIKTGFTGKRLPHYYKKRNETDAKSLAMHLCGVNKLASAHQTQVSRASRASKVIMTRDKLPFLLERKRNYLWLRDVDVILWDEAVGEYFIDIEKVKSIGHVKVYNDEYKLWSIFKPYELELHRKTHDYSIDRSNILINADKGVDKVLVKHGYGRVKTFGNEAPKILDKDLNIVFHGGIGAKHKRTRNVDAMGTVMPEEELAFCSYVEAILTAIPSHTFKIADGLDYKEQPFRGAPCKTNTVRATGSNALIESRIASIVNFPHPKAIAKEIIMTGEDVEDAIKRLIENKINQIVGRNTGYRAAEIVRKHPLYIEQEYNTNHHVIFLPELVKRFNLDLHVVTTNVFTSKSRKVPSEFKHAFCPGPEVYPLKHYISYKLEKMTPGTTVDFTEFVSRCAKDMSVSKKMVKRACRDIHDNDYYKDYVFRWRKNRPVLYVREDGYKIALDYFKEAKNNHAEYVSFKDVLDLVKKGIQKTGERRSFYESQIIELVERAAFSVGYTLLPRRSRPRSMPLRRYFVLSSSIFDKSSV